MVAANSATPAPLLQRNLLQEALQLVNRLLEPAFSRAATSIALAEVVKFKCKLRTGDPPHRDEFA